MKTSHLIVLGLLAFGGAVFFSQPALFMRLVFQTAFTGTTAYYRWVAPPQQADYAPEAAAIDALLRADPMDTSPANFPGKFRQQGEQLGVLVPPLSDTRIYPETIKANGRTVAAEWQDIFGVHSPGRLIHILYIHGGGFIMGSPRSHGGFVSKLIHKIYGRALVVDYALLPEHSLQDALDDCVASYQYLLSRSVSPSRIIIAGDSAGGGLTLLTAHAIKKLGLPQPAGLVLISPVSDISLSAPSVATNGHLDAMITPEFLKFITPIVTNNRDPAILAKFSPGRFPVEDFAGLAPALVIASTTEVLYDDALLIVNKYHQAGSQVTLIERPYLPHVYPLFADFIPEAQAVLDLITNWIKVQAN